MKILRINIPRMTRSNIINNTNSNGGGNITIMGGGSSNGGGSNGNTIYVVDNLTSSSVNDALSARQGKVLNEKINDINTNFENGLKEINGTIDTVSKNIDVINVTDLSNNTCYSTVGDAVKWLSDNAKTYHYKLHCGMSVKYRDYSTGKWLTYLYIGSSTDWKDANYNVAANWIFHAREKNIDIIDNLVSEETTEALSANQGRILNNTIADLDKKYLSKISADTANGLITFDKGLISNGNIAVHGYATNPSVGTGIYEKLIDTVLEKKENFVESDNFIARKTISTPTAIISEEIKSDDHVLDEQGWSIYKDEDGHYNLDIDNANIRGRLDVETLVVEEAKWIGGKLYCTKAGIICNAVEDKGTFYRCYFMTTNYEGLQIHNQFEIDDLAFSQTFHNNSIRRYWRAVVGKGENYIDISKDDCESKSDVPQAGDSIVQLGHKTDKTRQGAMVIEPLKLNIYNGINTYKLPAHTISLNPTLTEIKGKFINSATDEDITTTFQNLGDKIQAETDRVITDENGNITNIAKNGLVLSDEFNGLFSQQLTAHDEIITSAKLGTYNYVDDDELKSAIAGVTSGFTYDENGNITNIDLSGVVVKDDFAGLFSEQLNAHDEVVTKSVLGTYNYVDDDELKSAIAGVTSGLTYDSDGNLTNISKSGLVIKDDFSTLFSEQLNAHDEVITSAKLGTYNYVDNGELESAIAGVTSKLNYDENGNLTNIDKSGLVATSEFAGLFSTQLNAHNEVVTKAVLGTYNYVNNGQLESAIAGVTENLHYDSDGNLTNISKNGLVLSSEFAGLFTTQLNAHNEVVTKTVLGTYNYVDNGQLESAIAGITSGLNYDEDGNLTNISKNGLVLTTDFSTLFSAAVDADGNIVKSSQISTFITTDDANNLISNATIQADKINFNGKTIINNNFVVDQQGNLSINGNITANEGRIGEFSISEQGLYNLEKDSHAEIRYTNGNRELRIGGWIHGIQQPTPLLSIKNDIGYGINVNSTAGAISAVGKCEFKGSKDSDEIKIQGASFNFRKITVDGDKIRPSDDFVEITSNSVKNLYFPSVEDGMTAGKRIYIKNATDAGIFLRGQIMNPNNKGTTTKYAALDGASRMFIYDGTWWVTFFCG